MVNIHNAQTISITFVCFFLFQKQKRKKKSWCRTVCGRHFPMLHLAVWTLLVALKIWNVDKKVYFARGVRSTAVNMAEWMLLLIHQARWVFALRICGGYISGETRPTRCQQKNAHINQSFLAKCVFRCTHVKLARNFSASICFLLSVSVFVVWLKNSTVNFYFHGWVCCTH